MTNQFDGYTGSEFEIEILGVCRVRWTKYLPYYKSIAFARENQLERPCSKRYALQGLVSMRLGGKVKLYTAVSTPLDIFHGVDGFFESEGHVVTLDLTLNDSKDGGGADVIFNPNKMGWSELADVVVAEFSAKKMKGQNFARY